MYKLLKILYLFLSLLLPFGSANPLNLSASAIKGSGQSNITPMVMVLCIVVSLLDRKVRVHINYIRTIGVILFVFFLSLLSSEMYYDVFYGISGIDFIYYGKLFVAISSFIVFTQTFIAYPQILKQSLNTYAITQALIVFAFFSGLIDNAYYFSNGRLWFFGTNPNTYSFMVGFSLLIFANNLKQNKCSKLNKYICIIVIPILLFFIILTGSRGSLIFLLFSLCVLYYDNIKYAGIVVGIILVVMSYVFKSTEYDIIVFDRLAELNGDSSRKILIKQSLSIWSEHPIFGVGNTGYENAMRLLYNENKDSHNIFISTLVMGGVVGVLLLFTFFYLLFKRITRTRSSNKLFAMSVFIYMFLISQKTGSVLTYSLMWYVYATAFSSSDVKVLPCKSI